MENTLKILIVEDVVTDAEFIQREMRKNGFQLVCRIVETREDYLEALKQLKPDIIFSDYNLPSFDGMQALLLRNKTAPDVPFILVTGANNEEIAVDCMKAGADDYILKENMTRLGQATKAALGKKAVVKANKEAAEKLSILSRAVEQNPALIMITNLAGEIEYVNPKFTETTGYKPEEVLGKNPRFLKSGNQSDEFYAIMWQTILAGKEWSGELLNKKKNGDLYWEKASISPLLNAEGEITHLIGIKEDITEKRKMIVDLIHAKEKAENSDKLKTAFINNISHEVRTPLNTIEGFVEMLLSPDISEENKHAYTQIVKKSSSRLVKTIANYLDISMIVSGNMEIHKSSFSLSALLDKLKNEFQDECHEHHIQLLVEKPVDMQDLQLNSDPDLLYKIWSHLLSNAVKFTRQGEIAFGYRNSENGIIFLVRDTGIGIEKDKLKLIFDYFMQADVSETRVYEGSGLGLSIARELVRMLGGQINVQSEHEKGTIFTFTLAGSSRKTVADKPEVPAQQAEPAPNPLILVAEDDDFNFKYIDIILKRNGYLVQRAENGLQAVDYCKEHASAVNLILMDMKMPVMGGLDATRQIRSILPSMPIIALTAYVSVADENAAYEAGCNEFMSKPVNKEKLLGLMTRILHA